jgi:hypothetical protein
MEAVVGTRAATLRRAPERVVRAEANAWGLLPAIAVVAAGGVLCLAVADNVARAEGSAATGLYWLGVVAIVVPIAWRLFQTGTQRPERLGLVIVLGAALYLLKVMAWPLGYSFHDDLGQLRSTLDISATHHLFAHNPIVPAYSYYPGLEVVSNALAETSGLDPTIAGFVVIGAARVVLMVALFRLFELAGSSSRVAGVAVLLYAANSNFVYFDAQVAYESLALPLVVLALLAAVGRRGGVTASLLVPTLVIAATVVTHHVSAYLLALALVAWVLVGRSRRLVSPPVGSWVLAAAAVAAAAGWWAFAGRATERELGSIPASAITSVWNLALGRSAPRQLFHATNGTAEPRVTQLIGFASVVLVLVVLPFGVRRVLRQRNAISIVLLALAVCYPPSLVLRLTAAGTETSSRASEFVFLGVAYVLALALGAGPGRLAGLLPGSSALAAPAFVAYATVVLVGGIIIGWSPTARLPRPYQVGSPPRSIGPEGVETARWAGRELVPGSTVFADEANALLLAAYGRQAPTTGFAGAPPLLHLYRSRSLDAADRSLLDRTRYLVVDWRLTTALPLNGGYFSDQDPSYGLRRPLPAVGLRKFARVRGLDRIYDSGNIAIYQSG